MTTRRPVVTCPRRKCYWMKTMICGSICVTSTLPSSHSQCSVNSDVFLLPKSRRAFCCPSENELLKNQWLWWERATCTQENNDWKQFCQVWCSFCFLKTCCCTENTCLSNVLNGTVCCCGPCACWRSLSVRQPVTQLRRSFLGLLASWWDWLQTHCYNPAAPTYPVWHIMHMYDNADAKRILLVPILWTGEDSHVVSALRGSAPSNRIWNNTLCCPNQQIWLRTALCGGWCRCMALRNLRVACQKRWRRQQKQGFAQCPSAGRSFVCLSVAWNAPTSQRPPPRESDLFPPPRETLHSPWNLC